MSSKKLQEQIESLTLTIGDFKHKVQLSPDMFIRWGTPGQINFLQALIYVDPDVQNDTFLSVILHEILEAIVARNNLKMSHDVITTMEVALFNFLKFNKEFINVFYNNLGDSSQEETSFQSAEEFLQAQSKATYSDETNAISEEA